MDKYTATFGKGRGHILSIYAESVQEADAEIEWQLDHPGRRALLGQWQEGGRKMMVNDDSENVVSTFDTRCPPGAAGSWKRAVQEGRTDV